MSKYGNSSPTEWKMVRKPNPRDGWYEIGPAQAQFLLERGEKNRPLNEERAKRIAKEVQQGIWRENGESIIFDEDARLLDGQHRLRACVIANRPIIAYCVFGIPARFFPSLDTGMQRTSKDIAARMDFQNYSRIAATARLVLQFGGELAGRGRGYTSARRLFSTEEFTQFLSRNRQKLIEAVTVVMRRERKGLTHLIPLSHVAFIYYMATDKVAADVFVEKLATGEGLSKGDSILLFRSRMMMLGKQAEKLPSDHKLALLVKAWNAYQAGRSIGTLRWTSDEAFPKVQNGIDRVDRSDDDFDDDEMKGGRSHV